MDIGTPSEITHFLKKYRFFAVSEIANILDAENYVDKIPAGGLPFSNNGRIL